LRAKTVRPRSRVGLELILEDAWQKEHFMRFRWSLCALILLSCLPVLRAADASDENVTVIKLDVQTQSAPKPALKYLLLPELKDMQQGNSIPAYYKCFAEQHNFYFGKEANAEREKWLHCPLSDLPPGLEDYGGSSARQADYAARLDAPDWQILTRIRAEGDILLPDIQQLRRLGHVLRVRYRAQLKARKFDDAVRTHQTIFALGRHLGEHPSLVGELVGIAIANFAFEPLEEMIQQPGCPNLYWAFVQLPTHLVEIRKGLEGERIYLAANFGGLVNPKLVWDEDDLLKIRGIVARSGPFLDAKQANREKLAKWVSERLADEEWLTRTRRRLISEGIPQEKVMRYPPEQVIFHFSLSRYYVLRDELMKWASLPFWQAKDELVKGSEPKDDVKPDDLLAHSVLPTLHKVCQAQARLDQRNAMLQIVEGLRLYASENDGKLPQSLKDVKSPLPIDPMSGMAFSYKLDGKTAHIQGAAAPVTKSCIRYEVTIKK
jgi:hypothetical protein